MLLHHPRRYVQTWLDTHTRHGDYTARYTRQYVHDNSHAGDNAPLHAVWTWTYDTHAIVLAVATRITSATTDAGPIPDAQAVHVPTGHVGHGGCANVPAYMICLHLGPYRPHGAQRCLAGEAFDQRMATLAALLDHAKAHVPTTTVRCPLYYNGWRRRMLTAMTMARQTVHATQHAVHPTLPGADDDVEMKESGKDTPHVETLDALDTEKEGWGVIDHALSLRNLCSIEVGASGNCQFAALSYALHGTPRKHAQVRARVVAEMRAHPERYVEFAEEWNLPDEHDDRGQRRNTWAHYLRRIARRGQWGGHTTLVAAANAFNRVIHLFQDSANIVSVTPLSMPSSPSSSPIASAPSLCLAYNHKFEHYRGTRAMEDYYLSSAT